MKLNRLLGIVMLLLQRGQVTASELAEQFNVSPRTIYRDVAILSEAKVPVYTTQGTGGGIALMEGYAIQRTLLSPDEAQNMLLALKALRSTQQPEVDAVLAKLGQVFRQSPSDWLDIDLSPWGFEGVDLFQAMRDSILQQRVAAIAYTDGNGQQSQRIIEPMRLFFKGRGWYLEAFCRAREDFRTFRLSRIQDICLLEETFIRRTKTEPRLESPDTNVDLLLRFSPDVRYRIFDEFHPNNVQSVNGYYEVRIRYPLDEWVYGYLMGFCPFVEVLEPVFVREELTRRLEKALGVQRGVLSL